jgi:hypothetical protein
MSENKRDEYKKRIDYIRGNFGAATFGKYLTFSQSNSLIEKGNSKVLDHEKKKKDDKIFFSKSLCCLSNETSDIKKKREADIEIVYSNFENFSKSEFEKIEINLNDYADDISNNFLINMKDDILLNIPIPALNNLNIQPGLKEYKEIIGFFLYKYVIYYLLESRTWENGHLDEFFNSDERSIPYLISPYSLQSSFPSSQPSNISLRSYYSNSLLVNGIKNSNEKLMNLDTSHSLIDLNPLNEVTGYCNSLRCFEKISKSNSLLIIS